MWNVPTNFILIIPGKNKCHFQFSLSIFCIDFFYQYFHNILSNIPLTSSYDLSVRVSNYFRMYVLVFAFSLSFVI